ncbi:helix-turn-helix domain-containing protein [Paraburkholderia sp.]|uniref:AlbA family DNA-binding domain-containing protein n=1 Tax=Paraburkholderia sp. TaxID=1926495 RepID=UPI003C7C2827
MTDDELRQRLTDLKDLWVERKLEGLTPGEFRQTLSAFANALRPDDVGVLFIGVADNGVEIKGVANFDNIQQLVHQAAESCFPPIRSYESCALTVKEKTVVAVLIRASEERPHFTGPVYIRVGSDSEEISAERYEKLVANHDNGPVKRILRHTRDRASPVWDMSQERVFLESLMNQRFNFFVVFFSVVIAGAANAKSQRFLQLILTFGFIVELLICPLIYRAQFKLNLIVEYLESDLSHPMTIIDAKVKTKTKGIRRLLTHPRIRMHVMGTVAPSICCCILLAGAMASMAGWLEAPPQNAVQTTNLGVGTQARVDLLQGQVVSANPVRPDGDSGRGLAARTRTANGCCTSQAATASAR